MFFSDALEDILQMLRLLSERSGALAVVHEFGPERAAVLFHKMLMPSNVETTRSAKTEAEKRTRHH